VLDEGVFCVQRLKKHEIESGHLRISFVRALLQGRPEKELLIAASQDGAGVPSAVEVLFEKPQSS